MHTQTTSKPAAIAKTARAATGKRKIATAPAKAEKPAPKAETKPVTAPVAATKPDATERLTTSREARAVAAKAVREYYTGTSLPFKSAFDTFADLNLAKAPKQSTTRQAALFAVMLAADTAGNIKPDGSFIRGGFKLPLSLFKPDAKPDETRTCQPETGCLSDALGRVISYVSGPTSGKAQAETVLRLNLTVAEAEISAHLGAGNLGKAALARIATLRKAA